MRGGTDFQTGESYEKAFRTSVDAPFGCRPGSGGLLGGGGAGASNGFRLARYGEAVEN
jgi:hypothetical protein